MRSHTRYVITTIFTIILSLLLTSNLPAKQRGIKVIAKTPAGKEIPLYNDSYAFVVGNGTYTNGWDPLPGATRDIKDVARVLEENGFNVVLETNLTRNEFNRAFASFCYKYGRDKNNRLLFYYAGHGHTQKMFTGEDLGYLVMVDAPVPEKDPMGFRLSSVDMQSIVTEAKVVQARHVLFMFDSCFSGSILNLRERVVPEIISASVSLPVRQFITAGRANEPVPDHSIFKQAFLDLLEGRDKEPIPDGYITGEELGLYLKNKVPEYNPTQHPQYGKIKDIRLDKGDFVFALKNLSRPLPPVPPKSDGIRDYDKLIQQRETTKRKWSEWQIGMEKAFGKADRYDRSKELTSEEKKKIWGDFLSSYGTDNPYSTKDAGLRKKAGERVKYWKEYKVASIPEKPKYVPPSSTPNVIKRDGIYVAYANGIVKDTKTGLEWLVGYDDDTDWHEAGSFLASVNLDGKQDLKFAGGGWRLPTINELAGLYKEGTGDRNMTPLLKPTGWKVWSSDRSVIDYSKRRFFDFYDGSPDSSDPYHSSNLRAFAVRYRGDESPADQLQVSKQKIPPDSRRDGLKTTPDKKIKSKLFVKTTPANSRVRILNIKPKFKQGIELDPGKYHVEVSTSGYKTQKRWVELSSGEDKTISIRLESTHPKKPMTTQHINTLDAAALNDNVRSLLESGKNLEAIKALSKDIASDSKNAGRYYNNRGDVYFYLKQYAKSMKDFNKAIELKPDYALAYKNRGVVYSTWKKQYPKAIQDYDKAIELNPGYVRAYLNRAYLNNRYLDQHTRAIKDYDKVIELNPGDAEAYIGRGDAYLWLKQYARAIKDFDMAIELDPNNVYAYFYRGCAYTLLKQYTKAIQDYDKAIELEPDLVRTYLRRGEALFYLRQYTKSMEDFNKVIEMNPDYAQAYNNRGFLYIEGKNQPKRAIKDYNKAIKLSPNYAGAYFGRGSVYARLKQYSKAIQDYDKAIELDPILAPCYIYRGEAYTLLGRIDQACVDFKTACDLGECKALEIRQKKGYCQ